VSNKSGTSSQVISLPSGGGALQGIGETFAPDLHTGTGNFTVPIALPPGRNGFQPQLNLVYSTGNGNGSFGLGWDLSVPGVSRKTSKGIPRYRDTEDDSARWDTFILSGSEDLVPVALWEFDSVNGNRLRKLQNPTPNDFATAPVVQFRPRTEGLFAKIFYYRTADNPHWKVQSKDGLTSFYGSPRPRNAPANWMDPAIVADPDVRRKVCSWMLSRTEDTFGNQIVYDYLRDSDVDALRDPLLTPPSLEERAVHHWDQLYLHRIRYVDYDQNGAATFLASVTFIYEDRADHSSNYRNGFEVRTRLRCTAIEIRTHTDKTRLVRRYNLVYLDQRNDLANLNNRLPLNGVSLLSQIHVLGIDEARPAGEQIESLPPLEFSYTRFSPAEQDFFPIAGRDQPTRSLANPDLELADIFGNGLPDIIEMNGTVRYWRNLGNGQFDIPRPMSDAPAGVMLGDPDVQLIDADGDGRIDLLVNQIGLAGYYPLRFNGEWDRRSFQRQRLAPSFSFADPEVQLVDLNGDGVTDALRSGARLECFFNDPKEGWNATRQVERQALDVFPNINFSDPRVKWGDVTGDGLQDILLVHDGNIEYWPNLGYGDWGKRIHMRNSPRFPFGYDPRRILVGDVDGDGLDDIVYVADRRVHLWINQSGNRWSDEIVVEGTPPLTDVDAVRLVDLLGTGMPGVLWSRDALLRGQSQLFFLDFTGGFKPYLLHQMDNHMGAETHVEYAPSTFFYLQDQQNRQTRWQTPLPFPVLVVASVTVYDYFSRGKLTTEYRYHHGYWDGAEREFRGFGMVEQLDTQTFERYNAPAQGGQAPLFDPVDQQRFTPPTRTKTWFHQGPIGDEFGEWEESDFSAEYWSGDLQRLSRPQPMTAFLQSLPRRARRDVLRTLRGSILRTELYALDGSQREGMPYTVTEAISGVREESPPSPNDGGRLRIFFSHPLEQRTAQWERGDDPLMQFAFTDNYDDYGQPREQIAIAVPRGRDIAQTTAPGEPYLATLTRTDYAQRDEAEIYIVDRVARVTSLEIVNDGSLALFALRAIIQSNAAVQQIIGQTLTYYDGQAFEGLPLGQIGDHGAPVRSESLVLTQAILRDAYRRGDSQLNPAEEPPYLVAGGPNWPMEYPQEFRDRLPALAGYRLYVNGDPDHEPGYFVTTVRHRYDFHDNQGGRGLLKATRDPLGRDATIDYDRFELLPIAATDAVNLTTTADYDYRVLQPAMVTDPNGNRGAVTFTPLGLLRESFVIGKTGQNEGDSTTTPSTRLEYRLLAFVVSPPQARQPVSVRTIRREHHDTEIDVPLPERDATIETVEYSDGFGRLLQTRTQAEELTFGDGTRATPLFGEGVLPADQSDLVGTRQDVVGRQGAAGALSNVVVSGWQIYDNKGQVVEKFEPFFDTGWDYAPPTQEQFGQKATMFYDPRGQVIRTLNSDGSEQRVIYGVPVSLDDPNQFFPTPWEAYTYDANDLAALSVGPQPDGTIGSLGTRAPENHHFTPTSIVIDALGRTVVAVERNGRDQADRLITRSIYDIRGNVLVVFDALGRPAFQYVYDLANQPLRTQSIDAGVRRTVLDALGSPIEGRDSKGALMLHAYDRLNRPIRSWARDDANSPVTLRGLATYGDGGDPNQPIAERTANWAANRLGKPVGQYDEAGLLTFDSYDFKGNLLEKVRRVVRDEAILAVFPRRTDPNPSWKISPFRVDWQPIGNGTLADRERDLLDTLEYRSSMAYDALNRAKRMQYPQDVEGVRRTLLPRYNRAGALEAVDLDSQPYVEHIAYNAKGQRALIAYGNGVMTRYAYDTHTFRLVRLCTERFSNPAPLTYRPAGAPLQDFAYEYDLVGNITVIHDHAPGSGIPNTLLGQDALDRIFTYDPIYRLRSATGRECDLPLEAVPWDDRPRCTDVTRTRAYNEEYLYDEVGNINELRHGMNGGGFIREFALVPNTNRLATVTIGQNPLAYNYDTNGNMISETTSRHFEWNHSDQMKAFRTQVSVAEPSVYAHYLYDAGGQRVKKLVRKQGGGFEATTYIDGAFEHQRWQSNGQPAGQNNHLHVMDDQQRIALVRVGAPHPDDPSPAVQFHLGDHLGSSNLVISQDGSFMNREEHTPYGETSFGSFAKKRYRFTGRERDEESGLNYHTARYYAQWLGRWVSCDPITPKSDINPYSYVHNSPTSLIDISGLGGEKPEAIAEKAGVHAVEEKYRTIDKVTNITPPKEINSPGVDAHLIVGKGQSATNVIVDAKYSGKVRPQNVRKVESFMNSLRDNALQLRRNIINARRSGLLDKVTARAAYEDAHSGLVIKEVAVVGSNKDISSKLKNEGFSVTKVDTFPHIEERVQGTRFSRALGRNPKGMVTGMAKGLIIGAVIGAGIALSQGEGWSGAKRGALIGALPFVGGAIVGAIDDGWKGAVIGAGASSGTPYGGEQMAALVEGDAKGYLKASLKNAAAMSSPTGILWVMLGDKVQQLRNSQPRSNESE